MKGYQHDYTQICLAAAYAAAWWFLVFVVMLQLTCFITPMAGSSFLNHGLSPFASHIASVFLACDAQETYAGECQ